MFYLDVYFLDTSPPLRYLLGKAWVSACLKQKEGKFNSPLIVRFRVLVCTPTPTRWVLITSLRVTRFCEAGSYLTQKERKFNSPLNVCFCNGKRLPYRNPLNSFCLALSLSQLRCQLCTRHAARVPPRWSLGLCFLYA